MSPVTKGSQTPVLKSVSLSGKMPSFKTRYDAVAARPNPRYPRYGVMDFAKQPGNAAYVVLADGPFKVYRSRAEFKPKQGDVFVSSQDIDTIASDGNLAIKIGLPQGIFELPTFPLDLVVEGEDSTDAAGRPASLVDLVQFEIPLRITSYPLPHDPCEGLAYSLAGGAGKMPETEEVVALGSSDHPRVVFAYGQSIYLDSGQFEHPLAGGLTADIEPETDMVLRLLRKPSMDGTMFHSSWGTIIVIEDVCPH